MSAEVASTGLDADVEVTDSSAEKSENPSVERMDVDSDESPPNDSNTTDPIPNPTDPSPADNEPSSNNTEDVSNTSATTTTTAADPSNDNPSTSIDQSGDDSTIQIDNGDELIAYDAWLDKQGNTTTPELTTEGSDEDPNKSRIGYSSEGTLMPGFEDVVDEYLSFASDSDFTIFNRQIASDIPLQRLVAVKRLAASCERFGCDAALSLIDRIRGVAEDKEMVIRQTCAEQIGPYAKYLVEATQSSEKSHRVIIDDLLPLVKEMLRDAMEVRQAAGQSLVMMAELLNREEVYEHVLKIVLHMAHDDSDDQKITALPLLGDLAPIVGSAVCKNYLSSDLHALSQDNSFRVRKATVQYFGPICEQLGSDDAEKTLLPIFKQLCSDSIWSVRKGCVESFVDVANSIHQQTRAELVPIMEKFLTDSSRWVRNTAYEKLGPFISTLTPDQVSEDFLKYYTNIPHLSSAEADADCTNHCAFNFPAVALVLGKERWGELNETYNILVRKTFKSRKTLACSMHEVCKILGPELTEKYLSNAIEFFLKDIDDIREGIIKNFWRILTVFSDKKREEHLATLWELGSEADVNWRFRLLLAEQLDEITPLYPPNLVMEQMVPLTFQLCDDRMADVRYAAVRPIADLITYFKKQGTTEQIDEIIKKCNDIHSARTYSKRLLYIRLCESCLDRDEKEIFGQYFLDKLLEYTDDRISNVRCGLARFVNDRLWKDEYFKDSPSVLAAVIKLKQDTEDVEVRRFFCTFEEIEAFLRELKEREPPAEMPRQVRRHPDLADIDSSDSSLFSSSDEEVDENDAAVKDDDETAADDTAAKTMDDGAAEADANSGDENDEDLEKFSGIDINEPLQPEETEEDRIKSEENKASYASSKTDDEPFQTELIHQPTPYRLPDLDDSDDENDGPESKSNQANPSNPTQPPNTDTTDNPSQSESHTSPNNTDTNPTDDSNESPENQDDPDVPMPDTQESEPNATAATEAAAPDTNESPNTAPDA